MPDKIYLILSSGIIISLDTKNSVSGSLVIETPLYSQQRLKSEGSDFGRLANSLDFGTV